MTATEQPPTATEPDQPGRPNRRGLRGDGWARVRREETRAAQDEALAVLAEQRHYARRSSAYRALMLDRIHKQTALVGALLMLGLGAWSAVGVHHGVAAGAPPWSADWVLGWILEPVLLAGVALIVIVRSRLALAGTQLSGAVWFVELGLLSLSLAANVRALPVNPTAADGVLRLTGPVGCLLVSCVLVAVDRAIRNARIEEEPETAERAAARWDALQDRVRSLGVAAADRAVTAAEGAVAPGRDQTATTATNDRDHTATSLATTGTELVATSDPAGTGPLVPLVATSDHDPGTATGRTPGSGLVAPLTSGNQSATTAATTAPESGSTTSDQSGTSGCNQPDTTGRNQTDGTETTGEIPTVRNFITVEEAATTARTMTTEDLSEASERQLAERLGSGRSTARKAREKVLAERATDGTTEPGDKHDLTDDEADREQTEKEA